jgi:signal transduction histidine kinase/CheY-like chemotaxis protein
MASADAYPFPTLAAPARYALALGAVGIVLLLDRTFASLVDDGTEFLLLGTAVMAIAWIGGVGPALLAVVGGAVLGRHEADPVGATDVHLAIFIVHGLLVTAIVSEMRHQRHVAERRALEADHARRAGEAAAMMKDEFLATLSHELRTPLNAVLGWVHLIRTDRLDPATQRRGLESIERNVRRQAQITSDLLDVSEALTGQLHLDCRTVALDEAVRQAVRAVQPAARAKRVLVLPELPPVPVLVFGDAVRLRQIAWHVLANAIKFTPPDGTVRVAVRVERDMVRLTVADTGPGIAPEFLPRIFERFTQQDGSTTRVAGGLGMGLSLVRELVELHGGRIRAANHEGGGAIVTAEFPVQTPAAVPASMAREALAVDDSRGAPLDGIRVLVFEPDVEGRQVLRQLLEERGAAVQTAASLGDALESLEAWRPDVLVSDSAFDGGGSYSLVGKVPGLEAERGGRIPALALTSLARQDSAVRMLLDGTVREVQKPLEPARLTAEIARLAGRERRQMVR